MNLKKIGALTTLLILTNSCVSIPVKPETNEVQEAMKSTVKIRANVTSLRRSIPAKEGEEPQQVTEKWVGSGIVTDVNGKRNESLILTANHVATAEQAQLRLEDDGLYVYILKDIKLTVETLSGEMCDAKLVAGDEENDIAFIAAKCIAGNPAQIADKMPQVGKIVIISGAPMGYHPNNIFVVVEGFYLGRTDGAEKDVFSVPVAQGMSGSGVLCDGKIVAVVSQKIEDYENLTIAINLDKIKALYAVAETLWFSKVNLRLE